jgi:chromosome segregation ATPase
MFGVAVLHIGRHADVLQEQLSEARGQIEELQNENRDLKDSKDAVQEELENLQAEHRQQAEEVSNLRGRANLSQQNWVKERDELITREAAAREELENANQAMQDWEVIAIEERAARENLQERLSELEDRLSNQTEAYERAVAERDTQTTTVDGLQRALQDIQDGMFGPYP